MHRAIGASYRTCAIDLVDRASMSARAMIATPGPRRAWFSCVHGCMGCVCSRSS